MSQRRLPIEAWDHLVVRVRDLERSLACYREQLGFETEVDVEFGGEALETILEGGGSGALPARVRIS